MNYKIIIVFSLIFIVMLVSGCSNNTPDANTVSNNNLDNNIEDILSYEEGKVKVYFFWGEGCPHCNAQKQFFESIESKYPEMEILMFETYRNQSNVRLFSEFTAKHGLTLRAVPTTFIGDKIWVGFTNNIAMEIEQKIEYCLTNECRLPE